MACVGQVDHGYSATEAERPGLMRPIINTTGNEQLLADVYKSQAGSLGDCLSVSAD